MLVSIVCTVIFLAGYVAFVGSLLGYQKSEKPLPIMIWIPVSLVAAMCFHTFAAGIISILHIPVNLVSIGLIDLAVGLAGGYQIWRTKKVQKYEWKIADIIFLLLLIAAVIKFAIFHYTGNLTMNYWSVDAAEHFKTALGILKNQKVYGMFYAPLNNALLMETFSPLVAFSSYYKIFVLGDILNLTLGGLMFYGAIRTFCKDRFTFISAIVLTFLYLIGYQGNSTLFGFVYLGMGVTVIAYLITVTDMFLKDSENKWFYVGLFTLGCFGIFECYVLFMPVVFVAVLLTILRKQKMQQKLFSVETVVVGLAIFLIPCILGLYYIFTGIFTGGTTVSSAIAVDGGIYKDLYSNFVPYIPLALFGFYCGFRNKEKQTVQWLLPLWFLFMMGLLILGIIGKVSAYYYYKTYYVMWLLVLWLCMYGISTISVKERALVVIMGMLQLAMMGNYLFMVEEKIAKMNESLNEEPTELAFNNLLHFQWTAVWKEPYSLEKIELYQYVYDELLEGKDEGDILCAAQIEDYLWYRAITYQPEIEYMTDLSQSSDCILVLYDSQLYMENQQYFDSMNIMYETEAGFVAEVVR